METVQIEELLKKDCARVCQYFTDLVVLYNGIEYYYRDLRVEPFYKVSPISRRLLGFDLAWQQHAKVVVPAPIVERELEDMPLQVYLEWTGPREQDMFIYPGQGKVVDVISHYRKVEVMDAKKSNDVIFLHPTERSLVYYSYGLRCRSLVASDSYTSVSMYTSHSHAAAMIMWLDHSNEVKQILSSYEGSTICAPGDGPGLVSLQFPAVSGDLFPSCHTGPSVFKEAISQTIQRAGQSCSVVYLGFVSAFMSPSDWDLVETKPWDIIVKDSSLITRKGYVAIGDCLVRYVKDHPPPYTVPFFSQ